MADTTPVDIGVMKQAALRVARKVGYTRMTRAQIAAEAGCSDALVSHKFGSMDNVRIVVMRYAVEMEDLTVIAQGLVVRDPNARGAPPDLRRRALGHLSA